MTHGHFLCQNNDCIMATAWKCVQFMLLSDFRVASTDFRIALFDIARRSFWCWLIYQYAHCKCCFYIFRYYVCPIEFWFLPADVNTVGSLHSSEHDIRFEDFFWNGSGDEPLTLSLKSNARLTAVNGFAGRETFIKTATVIATVYIDDSVIWYLRRFKQKSILISFSRFFSFSCLFFFFSLCHFACRVKTTRIQIVSQIVTRMRMRMRYPTFIWRRISDSGSLQPCMATWAMKIFHCYKNDSLMFIASHLPSIIKRFTCIKCSSCNMISIFYFQCIVTDSNRCIWVYRMPRSKWPTNNQPMIRMPMKQRQS